ncbi:MAG: CD1871A family CXXC motif-containing protein [Peptoniphilus sp.]|nr:CD1871A family CXXC motif-containing protein [Peptoniphilus sp.]MDY3118290.1 CD1871A family CXXC motif-containing protein [Peptoniphilus sp.]
MKKEKWQTLIGPAFFLASMVMMAYGIHRGEMQVVFAKAVRICMECIGIG